MLLQLSQVVTVVLLSQQVLVVAAITGAQLAAAIFDAAKAMDEKDVQLSVWQLLSQKNTTN